MKSLLNWARKPLAVLGLVAGLSFGAAPAANAEAWNFSYTAGGINVAGQVIGVWNATYGIWSFTGISGTRDGNAITGLWEQNPANAGGNQNYIAGPTFGAVPVPPVWCGGNPGCTWFDQMDLHYKVGADQYAFGWITGCGFCGTPVATEGPVSNLEFIAPVIVNGTGRCDVNGQDGCVEATGVQISQVPEINASAGLQALALLFVFSLMMREMFLRRRNMQA